MKKILLILALITTLNGLSQTIHDANAEVRNVSGFTGISVSSAIDLYLSQGNTEAVAVSAKDVKYRDQIRTEVKNGVLHIWFDGKGLKNWGTGDQKMKAYVTIRQIRILEASGASDVKVSGTLKSDKFKMDFSGASDFEGVVEANSFDLEASGASDIKISGSATNAKIDMSGASDFKGYDFKIEYCKAEISGAGSMQIYVNKELDAEASGASSIRYRGDAMVKRLDSSGASSIKKKA